MQMWFRVVTECGSGPLEQDHRAIDCSCGGQNGCHRLGPVGGEGASGAQCSCPQSIQEGQMAPGPSHVSSTGDYRPEADVDGSFQ